MYKGTIEDVIRKMYQTEKKLDAVNPVAVKKKFDDRKDKDIDNDGDTDASDKFLHKKRKAVTKAVKKDAESNGSKDSVEVNTTMQHERTLTDKEKDKRNDVAKAIAKDDPNMPMDQKMAIATSVAKKTKGEDSSGVDHSASTDTVKVMKPGTYDKKGQHKKEEVEERFTPAHIKMAHGIANHPKYKGGDHTGAMKAIEKIKKGLSMHPTVQKHLKKANEDIIRRQDAKVVKVKGPDGRVMFKKMKPVVKVDDPRDHAMKSEETITEAEMNYKVSIEDLPDFFVSAKNPGEVKIKMRKMLKKPDMLNNVQRVPDAAMRKHFRLKAQGKDEIEQEEQIQPQGEQIVSEQKEKEIEMSPLVKAVSETLSRKSYNLFRPEKKAEEKVEQPIQENKVDEKTKANRSPDKDPGEKSTVKQGASDLHMCAKNVMHEKFGKGECLHAMHSDPDENGHVSHYDIMFDHGIEKDVAITECQIIKEMHHSHKGKEATKKLKKLEKDK